MTKILSFIVLLFLPSFVISQNLEIEGKAKITVMELMNTSDSLVVTLSDGTLARRDVSSILDSLTLEIINDTIKLSNSSYIVLPTDQVDDADADPNNEIQTISRTGTTVMLSNGGGTFEDSLNIYSAGAGIDITNNTISIDGPTSSTWPAFQAYNQDGGNQSTTGTFIGTIEVFDNNNDYSTTTGKFIAPIDGIYHFSWTAFTNITEGRTSMRKNGTIIMTKGNGKSISITINLVAGDEIYLVGTPVFPMHWYGAFGHNAFSGHLIVAQ